MVLLDALRDVGTEQERFDGFVADILDDTCRSLKLGVSEVARVGLVPGRWAAKVAAIAVLGLVESLVLAAGEELERKGIQPQPGSGSLLSPDNSDYPDRLVDFAEMFSAKVGSRQAARREGDGWHSLIPARQIRHRLVHPRSLQDSSVSQQDLAHVFAAAGWLAQEILPLFRYEER
jgi:hypothetical protein